MPRVSCEKSASTDFYAKPKTLHEETLARRGLGIKRMMDRPQVLGDVSAPNKAERGAHLFLQTKANKQLALTVTDKNINKK